MDPQHMGFYFLTQADIAVRVAAIPAFPRMPGRLYVRARTSGHPTGKQGQSGVEPARSCRARFSQRSQSAGMTGPVTAARESA